MSLLVPLCVKGSFKALLHANPVPELVHAGSYASMHAANAAGAHLPLQCAVPDHVGLETDTRFSHLQRGGQHTGARAAAQPR